jgi:hypothetical protein
MALRRTVEHENAALEEEMLNRTGEHLAVGSLSIDR